MGRDQTRHWFEFAQAVGVEGPWERMIDTVERAPGVIAGLEQKLPKNFPENVHVAIAKGVERHARDFLDGLEHLEA